MFTGPSSERITVAELLQALREDKRRRGRHDPASEMRKLSQQWGARAAVTVTAPEPVIKRLSETGNERTGVFTSAEFERLLAELPHYLQDFTRWGRITGWRAGSIRSLRGEEVDEDKILCRVQYSKDRTAHSIALAGPLREIIDRRRAERTGPYVFSYSDGRPIGDYKNAWKGAPKRAGLRGKLFHELRRVAATELRRAGVPEDVAMQITGHLTRSMFSRYNIVDLGDVSRAIEQRKAYQNQQPVASVRVQ